uniref:RNase H type-1 domain-containing protein n=1 Tax=Quercus lobata TaxID=97700 RepID=A0A7N2L8S2_QUELO
MRIPLPQSVAEVKALGCRRAVQFAIEIGLQEVIFEGDAVVVIQAAKDGLADQSMYGHLIGGILQQASELCRFEFFCVNRTCNRVANALASRTSVGLDLQFWLEDCPGDIAPLVFADVP